MNDHGRLFFIRTSQRHSNVTATILGPTYYFSERGAYDAVACLVLVLNPNSVIV